MKRTERRSGLLPQLGTLLRVTGARPRRWIGSTVAASVALALLDMAGVAAMIPLMQLITSGSPEGGFLQWVVGMVGTDELSTLIPFVAGIVVIAFIVKSAGALAFRWWLLGRTTRVSALAAAELMNRYVLSPYTAHRARSLTVVYRNINDCTNQATSVLLASVTLCTDVLMLAAIMVVLAAAAPLVTLFAVALFGGLVFGVQRILRARQLRIGEDLAEAGLEAWQSLMPGLDGFRETRLTSSASSFVRGFRNARLRGARLGREMSFISDVPRYLLEVSFIIAIIGIAGILFAIGQSAEVIPILGLFATASMRALPTMNRVSASLATARSGQAGMRIMTETLDELEAGGRHEETPRSGPRPEGDIVLDGVTFAYPDADQPVLTDLNLTITENRTTAFTGGSGAGKTTVVDIVLGLLTPTSGAVRCGDRLIDDDLASWYSGIGVVPQDVFLVNASVAQNIAFGEDAASIDLERVRDAAGQAQLTDLLQQLPQGVDTVVGDRGVRLSGGQRQRIGLARALYRRPRLLVLDEATSALDNATEREIAQTLEQLRGRMTIVIVAHRLSTVRSVDHLIHLRGGRIAAEGTFDEVRDRDPEFARLVELGQLE
ncbi:ABC transporter ATP-binding protein [Microbacterium sp. SD291]|uniref:ABC transporter ATP-binding protein n=1 Tax=Microbacterium sp. SD291 TaxID=2782007 RepID=UPI001A95B55F|nr:ABC transporter ATP-binding protein [Microbacterium sp. SD291]MBO0980979.1 ABC transporter ATP-binding protein [Microbacterium sp. SD291]